MLNSTKGAASQTSAARSIANGILYAANIYVSEGRDMILINKITSTLFKDGDVCNQSALVNTFVDKEYNRTGFTLVSRSTTDLSQTAVQLSELALSQLDLRSHVALHPRLGTVDHISIHPLHLNTSSLARSRTSAAAASASTTSSTAHTAGSKATSSSTLCGEAVALAADCAHRIGKRLKGMGEGLPVYYYGWAHPEERRLAEIRRKLGYFKGNAKQTPAISAGPAAGGTLLWQGALPISGDLGHYPPDEGPQHCSERSGLITIGASPWIINYNVPLTSGSLDQAKSLSRSLSERGGGLPFVEAMALAHGDSEIEVACNLLDPDSPESSPQAVQQQLEELGRHLGVGVGVGYCIGRSPQEYVDMASHMLMNRV